MKFLVIILTIYLTGCYGDAELVDDLVEIIAHNSKGIELLEQAAKREKDNEEHGTPNNLPWRRERNDENKAPNNLPWKKDGNVNTNGPNLPWKRVSDEHTGPNNLPWKREKNDERNGPNNLPWKRDGKVEKNVPNSLPWKRHSESGTITSSSHKSPPGGSRPYGESYTNSGWRGGKREKEDLKLLINSILGNDKSQERDNKETIALSKDSRLTWADEVMEEITKKDKLYGRLAGDLKDLMKLRDAMDETNEKHKDISSLV